MLWRDAGGGFPHFTCGNLGGSFLARHPQSGKQIKHLIFVDEMDALGVQTNKMRAILATLAPLAGIDAE